MLDAMAYLHQYQESLEQLSKVAQKLRERRIAAPVVTAMFQKCILEPYIYKFKGIMQSGIVAVIT